jgi:dTDP-4-amino-4,6-dideoxygalactose transaminase
MQEIPVPFLDLKLQYRSIESEITTVVRSVLESSQYVLGPEVTAFEEEFAVAHKAAFCLGVNNGTSALHLALWGLGIKTGDEVILPVNTFIATAEAVVLCGATPVLVDHEEYFNIDPNAIGAAITSKTKAIIAVHLYGQAARMEEIKRIALEHGLFLIEDAAQAHLATFDDKFVGSWGDATCFSFYPGKNLGAYGEAGAVLCNRAELAKRMRIIRDHGSHHKYDHVVMGHNYRMEALQGAFLRVKLRHLPAWTAARRERAEWYQYGLASISQINCPKIHPKANPVWHLYVVQAEDREELQQHLASCGISTGLHYPVPLDRQPAFAAYDSANGSYPRSDAAVSTLLSLPMFPEMTKEQSDHVIASIKLFYQFSA